jgi:protein-disulfide isomerase
LSSSRRPRQRQRQGPASRRERREEDRRAARAPVQRSSGGLPILWLTGAVVVLAVVVIVVLLAANRTPGSGAAVATPLVTTPVADASDRSIGPSTASVKLDLWADFQCPVCKQFTESIEPQIVNNYIATGEVQLTFHDFAFIGPESTQAAIGGLCAADQGKFWPYHDYVYANQGTENSGVLSDSRLEAIAGAVGLDVSKFTTCLGSSANQQEVQKEAQQAQSMGITGTPTLYVNGTKVSNALDFPTVQAAIDAALQSAGSPSASPSPTP